MADVLPTTERLALALELEGAPAQMVDAARAGCYDDFRSESATPMNGEFDSTQEEAEAWFQREGKDLLKR